MYHPHLLWVEHAGSVPVLLSVRPQLSLLRLPYTVVSWSLLPLDTSWPRTNRLLVLFAAPSAAEHLVPIVARD